MTGFWPYCHPNSIDYGFWLIFILLLYTLIFCLTFIRILCTDFWSNFHPNNIHSDVYFNFRCNTRLWILANFHTNTIDYGFWSYIHTTTMHSDFWPNFHPYTIDYRFWHNFHCNTIDYEFWPNFHPNTIDRFWA